jgi:demethylmenaquinone methyltransferase/2-methoxy-6-polyprenyl-1,4-benzoquinol methylase
VLLTMPTAGESMEDYYAARAAEYDRIYLKPERQEDLRAIERWLPARFTDRAVLEVACGTGWWTRVIAPVARSVLGVDAAAETLAIARSRVPADNVTLVVGDAYRLPVAAASCDAAFAGFWWSHVPRAKLRAFLEGLHVALRPGAPVVFLDNRYVEGSSTPLASRDAAGDTWQERRLEDGSTHRVLKNFPTADELRAAVTGLADDVRHHEWAHYWALEYKVAAP